jgi:CTP synthase (UTP-ammonia lyase)
MKTVRVALLGDYSPAAVAHQAIPRALERAGAGLELAVSWDWVPTPTLLRPEQELGGYHALWAVPRTPYANPEGVLAAIGWARRSGRPFLGTCGGFQHAVLEFARQVADLPAADHAESSPKTPVPVIAELACGLVETTGTIHFAAGSRLRAIYGCALAEEGYHCRYGVNPAYRARLEEAGLHFTAWDAAGDIRAAELPEHPFFFGTLFQPERAALRGESPPLVAALLRVAAG